jgi:DNA-binding CsgD family transcriptional regulator
MRREATWQVSLGVELSPGLGVDRQLEFSWWLMHDWGTVRSAVSLVRVAVLDEHEIFRRGVVACLAEDRLLSVVVEAPSGPLTEDVAVAVVSTQVALAGGLTCPLVVCTADPRARLDLPRVTKPVAILPRSTLTAQQLVASVHAAAVGLRVEAQSYELDEPQRLEERTLEVLRLLAEGATTQEISTALSYSERTIKSLIHELERKFRARSRAQLVAQGIRQGFITAFTLVSTGLMLPN